MTERPPTVKEQILASLQTHGPGGYDELALRLVGQVNHNSLRRELVAMTRRDEVQVHGRQLRHGEIGRQAYIYAHPEHPLPPEVRVETIRPSSPEVEVVPPPLVFGDALPAHALKLSREYQILWRNGLKSNGLGVL